MKRQEYMRPLLLLNFQRKPIGNLITRVSIPKVNGSVREVVFALVFRLMCEVADPDSIQGGAPTGQNRLGWSGLRKIWDFAEADGARKERCGLPAPPSYVGS